MKLKKYLILTIIMGLLLGLAGCGGETASSGSGAAGEIVDAGSDAQLSVTEDSLHAEEMTSVDMIYYLDLGEGTIMAAAYTDEGVAQMGSDYYVVHVSDAEIYNAAGEKCTMEDLPRGVELKIQWPGMVMESYPAQIAAYKITALSDTPVEGLPAEDEIPAVNGGEKWWEPEPVVELPGMTLEYTTDAFVVAQFLQGGGSWSCEVDGQMLVTEIDVDAPLDTAFDDGNTIKRKGFDTIRLNTGPDADTMTVEAYVDGSETPVPVELDGDGSMQLLEGSSVIYVVSCQWNTTYTGQGSYVFLVTEE